MLPPAPGQGIIAVVAREKDTDLIDLLNKASDPKARAEALAERAFLRTIGGGCHVPVGGIAIHEGGARMEFIAGMADLNGGERKVLVKLSGSPSNPEELGGVNAARELLKRWSEG